MVALAASGTALAETTTYTATKTIPVPPASNYAGAGGGDGWAIVLSSTQVFNVFHHNGVTTLSCHSQSDASQCYTPRTITDGSGNNFGTSGHPGMFLDQKTGKLYVYATRGSDSTGGVVCIDTTIAATNPNPFCGYTALTAPGDGPEPYGWSTTSTPMQVGTKWYSFNYVSTAAPTGGKDKLMCFDLTTFSACAGQPFSVNIGAGEVSVGAPSPATAAIGTQIIIPITTGGNPLLACFDASTAANCAGKWPVAAPSGFPGSYGSPFPLMDGTGKITGLCLPTGTDQCYDLTGASVTTPAGMPAAIGGGSVSWSGTGLVLGPRVYVPVWSNVVDCFDYSTGASCTNFPKSFNNLGLLYTVNADPQRPTCIWVNSDNGSAQIQNFDAYTGGACGEGNIRVLASQFVVPQPQCTPASYLSLQVLKPEPSTYTSGSVGFNDGDGNPIPGAADRPLDKTGTVDLSGLALNTATGLPQFVITLVGETGKVGSVEVKLTWKANYDATCVGETTEVEKQPTELTTNLAGGGKSGSAIIVPEGTAVTDQATLSGTNAAGAAGKVSYTAYSDPSCTKEAGSGGEVTVSGGAVPASGALTLAPGTYYWQAAYGGDAGNKPSTSPCGAEIETVEAGGPPKCTRAEGWGSYLKRFVPGRLIVNDSLSTNLASPQKLLVNLESGLIRFRLVKLESASCGATAGGGLRFSGSGLAMHENKPGYNTAFWIEVKEGKTYFYARLLKGTELINEATGAPLTKSTEKIF
jgi:hypothetical protein